MNIKAVIFDLDGVIVSTDQYHYKAWKQLADKEDIPFDETINNQLRGVSRMESLEIILKNADRSYDDKEKFEMTEYKNDIYRKSLEDLSEDDILPGFWDVYHHCRDNNIKMAVGSSSKNTKKILKAIGLDDAFDAVADGTDIENSKPDPEVFWTAAARLGIDSKFCLVVEDAVSGIEAAKNGGMVAVAIGDATSSEKADHTIKHLRELIKLL